MEEDRVCMAFFFSSSSSDTAEVGMWRRMSKGVWQRCWMSVPWLSRKADRKETATCSSVKKGQGSVGMEDTHCW